MFGFVSSLFFYTFAVMKKIKVLVGGFIYWVILFLLLKVAFMLYNWSTYSTFGLVDWLKVLWHGLPLDFSLAGYLTVFPALSLIVSVWASAGRQLRRFYYLLMTCVVVFLHVLNAVLYGYWRFPLDTTPIFYFFSSPRDALASAGTKENSVLILLLILFAASFLICLHRRPPKGEEPKRKPHRILATLMLSLCTALLFLPIRGGVTVSTMNTGEVYFSENESLNHAAVNPVFSLMESFSKQRDFAAQYRFMDDGEATRIFHMMTPTSSDSTRIILKQRRPDVFIIVMESFSRLVMKTGATPNLCRLADEGVMFENFYANSFRTDRGLVAVLSGFPAQPSMSIMKYTGKASRLPSIARSMIHGGYKAATYYYGGDIDFCSQRAYLVSQGYTRLISDKDFPLKYRMSKWGVPDGPLFDYVERDINSSRSAGPALRVIQTSSSHEPFDVPVRLHRNKRLNAFAYTDMQIGRFIDGLKRSGRWRKSVVILVADHLGAYPERIDNLTLSRFQIPLIITGGAVEGHQRLEVYGSQQDIAATLLAQLGIRHEDFIFSKDMLDPSIPHFAFFTIPDAFGMADSQNRLIYDSQATKIVVDEGPCKGSNLLRGKAYLQKLYDVIANL